MSLLTEEINKILMETKVSEQFTDVCQMLDENHDYQFQSEDFLLYDALESLNRVLSEDTELTEEQRALIEGFFDTIAHYAKKGLNAGKAWVNKVGRDYNIKQFDRNVEKESKRFNTQDKEHSAHLERLNKAMDAANKLKPIYDKNPDDPEIRDRFQDAVERAKALEQFNHDFNKTKNREIQKTVRERAGYLDAAQKRQDNIDNATSDNEILDRQRAYKKDQAAKERVSKEANKQMDIATRVADLSKISSQYANGDKKLTINDPKDKMSQIVKDASKAPEPPKKEPRQSIPAGNLARRFARGKTAGTKSAPEAKPEAKPTAGATAAKPFSTFVPAVDKVGKSNPSTQSAFLGDNAKIGSGSPSISMKIDEPKKSATPPPIPAAAKKQEPVAQAPAKKMMQSKIGAKAMKGSSAIDVAQSLIAKKREELKPKPAENKPLPTPPIAAKAPQAPKPEPAMAPETKTVAPKLDKPVVPNPVNKEQPATPPTEKKPRGRPKKIVTDAPAAVKPEEPKPVTKQPSQTNIPAVKPVSPAQKELAAKASAKLQALIEPNKPATKQPSQTNIPAVKSASPAEKTITSQPVKEKSAKLQALIAATKAKQAEVEAAQLKAKHPSLGKFAPMKKEQDPKPTVPVKKKTWSVPL